MMQPYPAQTVHAVCGMENLPDMEALDKDTAKKLFDRYRKQRDGIRKKPQLASICLICGSSHIVAKDGDAHQLVCFNCGFAFYRYACPACGLTIDGRDPMNPGCLGCNLRICSCGACGCPSGNCD